MFLPGKFHGEKRSLAGHGPLGSKESTNTCTSLYLIHLIWGGGGESNAADKRLSIKIAVRNKSPLTLIVKVNGNQPIGNGQTIQIDNSHNANQTSQYTCEKTLRIAN